MLTQTVALAAPGQTTEGMVVVFCFTMIESTAKAVDIPPMAPQMINAIEKLAHNVLLRIMPPFYRLSATAIQPSCMAPYIFRIR
jgi:hypothetical protein